MDEFIKLSEEQLNKKFADVPVEEVQSYWNKRPCNINHSPLERGSRAYFEQVGERKYFVEPHIPKFAQFPAWRGKRVLEVGCGLGTESVNFAQAGAAITVTDLSDESLRWCEKRFDVMQLRGRFLQANAEKLSSYFDASERFDLIWSFGVIHHTPHPDACVAEFRRLLSDDGVIKIMVYAKISYKLFFLMRETNDWQFGTLDNLIAFYSEAQTGCPVTYTYTLDEVRNELLADWDIIDMTKAHIFTWNIDEYRKYNYVKEDCWANVPDDELDALEKELGWHICVTAKPKKKKAGDNAAAAPAAAAAAAAADDDDDDDDESK